MSYDNVYEGTVGACLALLRILGQGGVWSHAHATVSASKRWPTVARVTDSPEKPVVGRVLLHTAMGVETQVQTDPRGGPREIEVPRVQHLAHF